MLGLSVVFDAGKQTTMIRLELTTQYMRIITSYYSVGYALRLEGIIGSSLLGTNFSTAWNCGDRVCMTY